MTVLIAYRFDNGVFMVADKKQSNLSFGGDHVGTYTLGEKITSLHPSMLMGTAGVGLGNHVRDLMRFILNTQEDLNNQETMDDISGTIKQIYNMYKKVNPHIAFDDFVTLIGGYDVENNRAFLYKLTNLNGFKYTRLNEQIIIESPSEEITNIIGEYIAQNMIGLKNIHELVPVCTAAIRSIDHPSVSKETFAIFKFYDGETGNFLDATYEYDKNGIEIEDKNPVTPQ